MNKCSHPPKVHCPKCYPALLERRIVRLTNKLSKTENKFGLAKDAIGQALAYIDPKLGMGILKFYYEEVIKCSVQKKKKR